MTNWYYYDLKFNRPQGPIEREVMVGMLRRGGLTAESMVWTEGMEAWLPLSQTELAAEVPRGPIDIAEIARAEVKAGSRSMSGGIAPQPKPPGSGGGLAAASQGHANAPRSAGAAGRNPQQFSPGSAAAPVGSRDTLRSLAAFGDLQSATNWVGWMSMAKMVLAVIALAGLIMAGMTMAAGGFDEASANDPTVAMGLFVFVGGVSLWGVAALVQMIFYLIWCYRAKANCLALGAQGMMIDPLMAVVWHFIPIMSAIMPYLNLSETWRASRNAERWTEQSSGLSFWLYVILPFLGGIFLVIVSFMATAMAASSSQDDPLIVQTQASLAVMVAAGLIVIAFDWLMMSITSEIHDEQVTQFNGLYDSATGGSGDAQVAPDQFRSDAEPAPMP